MKNYTLLLIILLLFSCKKEEPEVITPKKIYTAKCTVVNESNKTITVYIYNGQNQIVSNVFFKTEQMSFEVDTLPIRLTVKIVFAVEPAKRESVIIKQKNGGSYFYRSGQTTVNFVQW